MDNIIFFLHLKSSRSFRSRDSKERPRTLALKKINKPREASIQPPYYNISYGKHFKLNLNYLAGGGVLLSKTIAYPVIDLIENVFY